MLYEVITREYLERFHGPRVQGIHPCKITLRITSYNVCYTKLLRTGIDFGNAKNCVGTFYPASLIRVSVSYLASLSEAAFRSGLAEVMKTALLYAPKLFQIMQERREHILSRDPDLVITSYSIHYTKLYEYQSDEVCAPRPKTAVRIKMRAINRVRITESSLTTPAREWHSPGKAQ